MKPLRRFHDKAPPEGLDVRCGECGLPARYVGVGTFGPFWSCTGYPGCDALVGAHADGRPLGVPMGKETRDLRKQCHAEFDQLWRGLYAVCDRNTAYYYLARQLGISRNECHFAKFDAAMCRRALDAIGEIRGPADDHAAQWETWDDPAGDHD